MKSFNFFGGALIFFGALDILWLVWHSGMKNLRYSLITRRIPPSFIWGVPIGMIILGILLFVA